MFKKRKRKLELLENLLNILETLKLIAIEDETLTPNRKQKLVSSFDEKFDALIDAMDAYRNEVTAIVAYFVSFIVYALILAFIL